MRIAVTVYRTIQTSHDTGQYVPAETRSFDLAATLGEILLWARDRAPGADIHDLVFSPAFSEQEGTMAAEAERQLFGMNAGDGEKLVKVIERQSFVMMELMQAYKRRVRSDCKTQEELDKRPWECAEYRAAADLLRTLHSPEPSEN